MIAQDTYNRLKALLRENDGIIPGNRHGKGKGMLSPEEREAIQNAADALAMQELPKDASAVSSWGFSGYLEVLPPEPKRDEEAL